MLLKISTKATKTKQKTKHNTHTHTQNKTKGSKKTTYALVRRQLKEETKETAEMDKVVAGPRTAVASIRIDRSPAGRVGSQEGGELADGSQTHRPSPALGQRDDEAKDVAA